MTRTFVVGLAILTLSTSVALAAHRTHHRNAMNAHASMGATPVVWPGGVSSGDHALYLRNLRDSGYNPKNDYANGLIKTQ